MWLKCLVSEDVSRASYLKNERHSTSRMYVKTFTSRSYFASEFLGRVDLYFFSRQ